MTLPTETTGPCISCRNLSLLANGYCQSCWDKLIEKGEGWHKEKILQYTRGPYHPKHPRHTSKKEK